MSDLKVPLIIFGVIIVLATCASPVQARCIMSYCKEKSAPKRTSITNVHRQVVGDLYMPGHGRRTQIRNKHRQIIGYIESDGSITNLNRQKTGEINGR